MHDVEAILEDAGARWRASQPPLPALDVATVLDADRGRRRPWLLLAGVGVAVILVAVVSLTMFMSPRRTAPAGGMTQPGAAVATPAGVVAKPSSAVATPPSGRAGCTVTKPVPVFVPPSPYLAEDPTPAHAWFGAPDLWTSLFVDGESWGPTNDGSLPIPQKTFWWSVDWSPDAEPEPAIAVIGTRLDGSGSFRYGHPGTNASAAFGTAMLVGVDVPSGGCWRITGRFRAAELSYVVWVEAD
jgi:hypothetical protein